MSHLMQRLFLKLLALFLGLLVLPAWAAPTLTSIDVTPKEASVAKGTTVQFKAMGMYSDGTTQDITTTAVWTMKVPTVAAIGNKVPREKGLAVPQGAGTSAVTASIGAVTGTAQITVTGVIGSEVTYVIIPAPARVAAGESAKLTLKGTVNGKAIDLTEEATWSVQDSSVATLSSTAGSKGTVTGVRTGSTRVTATARGQSASAEVIVGGTVLRLITVTPDTSTVGINRTTELVAMGTYSDGTKREVAGAQWSSNNASVVSLQSNSGGRIVIRGNALGNSTVTAHEGSVSDTAVVTVTQRALDEIRVSAVLPRVPLGDLVSFKAIGRYSDGSEVDITSGVTWTVTDGDMDFTGPGTGKGKRAEQWIHVKASQNRDPSHPGISGSGSAYMTSPAFRSVEITPAKQTFDMNPYVVQLLRGGQRPVNEFPYKVDKIYSDGTRVDATNAATTKWSASKNKCWGDFIKKNGQTFFSVAGTEIIKFIFSDACSTETITLTAEVTSTDSGSGTLTKNATATFNVIGFNKKK